MKRTDGRSGQVAVFLVMILAGLALFFALNVDIFVSSRAKTRLQNAADASAMEMARWQGMTLNLLGDLNLAHLAAVCRSNENAIAGIVRLQERISFIGPTAGLRRANALAAKNGIGRSREMSEIMDLVSGVIRGEYGRMIREATGNDVRIGIDNAAFIRAGLDDPRFDPDFYEAVIARDFAELCRRFGRCAHRLPDVDEVMPDPSEVLNGPGNPYFGSTGVMWEEGSDFLNHVAAFESLARSCGLRSEITAAGLVSNACLLATRRWCVLSESEWRDWMEFDYSHFPSVAPVRDEYNVSGGSTTVRVEGSVALSAAAGETNAISGKAAAKVFGSIGGKRVTSAPARLVLPAFSFVRLVPYGPGAAGRYGMASLEHVRSIMGLMGVPESLKASPYYLRLLQMYNSNEYRELAEKWYSSHCHGSSCCPPQPPGGEPGGGTPYGM